MCPEVLPPVQLPLDALGLPPPQLFTTPAAEVVRRALSTSTHVRASAKVCRLALHSERVIDAAIQDVPSSCISLEAWSADFQDSALMAPVQASCRSTPTSSSGAFQHLEVPVMKQAVDVVSPDAAEMGSTFADAAALDVEMASPLGSVQDPCEPVVTCSGALSQDGMEVDGEDDSRQHPFFANSPTEISPNQWPLCSGPEAPSVLFPEPMQVDSPTTPYLESLDVHMEVLVSHSTDIEMRSACANGGTTGDLDLMDWEPIHTYLSCPESIGLGGHELSSDVASFRCIDRL
ncbi:hypothetical protein OE88DRAFT_1465277 [Heliocybe sulcata]|uniref:Uncharacterized protein n=1 Tax=Heliocybe sulcata TaxID=5364 RepID=A0A5C3N2Y8_9AGAM|nr:hypothetical protein OE88DRAFT_1465277 [Heliocybe sulcata]